MSRFQRVSEPSILPAGSSKHRPAPEAASRPAAGAGACRTPGSSAIPAGAIAPDVHRPDRHDLHVPAARDHRPVRGTQDSSERADARRRHHQRRRGMGAGARALRPRRRADDLRQHLRLHRRQGRLPAAPPVVVRRVLGFDARSLLGSRAAGGPDLSLFVARTERLRDGRRA